MTCLSIEQLAAAAADEPDDAAIDHLGTCAACCAVFDDQLAARALIGRLPPVVLTFERRASLAAEVLAQADAQADVQAVIAPRRLPASRARRRLVVCGLALAAAATIALVLAARDQDPVVQASDGDRAAPGSAVERHVDPPAVPDRPRADTAQAPVVVPNDRHADEPRPAPADRPRGPHGRDRHADRAGSGDGPGPRPVDNTDLEKRPDPVPAAPDVATVFGSAADFARDTTVGRDVVTLREGQVAVDATRARPVRVVAGVTRVEIASARASIVARRGVIESVTVLAGSVEVTVGARRHVIEAGQAWELPGSRDTDAQQAFRTGWTALRAGSHADAIAAFDRAVMLDSASEPVVAEDAAYWAAIAAERSGDRAGSVKRYTEFLTKFPRSPRAEAARAAVRRQ